MPIFYRSEVLSADRIELIYCTTVQYIPMTIHCIGSANRTDHFQALGVFRGRRVPLEWESYTWVWALAIGLFNSHCVLLILRSGEHIYIQYLSIKCTQNTSWLRKARDRLISHLQGFLPTFWLYIFQRSKHMGKLDPWLFKGSRPLNTRGQGWNNRGTTGLLVNVSEAFGQLLLETGQKI